MRPYNVVPTIELSINIVTEVGILCTLFLMLKVILRCYSESPSDKSIAILSFVDFADNL